MILKCKKGKLYFIKSFVLASHKLLFYSVGYVCIYEMRREWENCKFPIHDLKIFSSLKNYLNNNHLLIIEFNFISQIFLLLPSAFVQISGNTNHMILEIIFVRESTGIN